MGTDVCENARISTLVKKYQSRFLNRIYTQEEQKYCMMRKNPIPHLSARFALKEAFIKALGIRRDLSLSYADVSLSGQNTGKKEILVERKLQEIMKQKKANAVFFSIAHGKQFSTATVILEYRDDAERR